MANMQLPVLVNTQRVKEPRLDLYYPVVHGLKSIAVQRRINYAIQNLVKKMLSDQGYYSNPRTQVTASYEVKTNERGVLSLSLNNYAFAGGAHGMTIIKSLTFDVCTGRIYSLADLFKPGSDYQKVLSAIIEKQIKEREIPVINEFTGIKPDQDYYIADKVLVVYFQLYDLTPYAYGFPEFPITVYQVEDIVDENGPLGRMIPAIGI
jgi:hypothetical protein